MNLFAGTGEFRIRRLVSRGACECYLIDRFPQNLWFVRN